MQVVFLPLSCLVGKSFFGWGNWHKHHYVFVLLLLYQSLSSACVKLHFVLLLHVWNICLGCTFLFFNTALSVMPAMRLSHRASLAGSAAVFSKLYSLCRSRSVFNIADVLLRHVIFSFFFFFDLVLLLNLTFYPTLTMNFSEFRHPTHLPTHREICEAFCHSSMSSHTTLVLVYTLNDLQLCPSIFSEELFAFGVHQHQKFDIVHSGGRNCCAFRCFDSDQF